MRFEHKEVMTTNWRILGNLEAQFNISKLVCIVMAYPKRNNICQIDNEECPARNRHGLFGKCTEYPVREIHDA